MRKKHHQEQSVKTAGKCQKEGLTLRELKMLHFIENWFGESNGNIKAKEKNSKGGGHARTA